MATINDVAKLAGVSRGTVLSENYEFYFSYGTIKI